MDLHGQSDLSPSCLGPRVAFFSEPEPWAYKQSTPFFFSLFELFEILQLPALLLSLPPRVALFFRTSAVGPQAIVAFYSFFPNDLRCGFRKLKERGVGNRTSGAVLVPESLLLLTVVVTLHSIILDTLFFFEPEPWAYKQLTHFSVFEILK